MFGPLPGLCYNNSHMTISTSSTRGQKSVETSIFVFDAGPLITACKFDAGGQLVIDHISERCEIVVAASVRDEVIVAGARYPDARAARQRIEQGKIAILTPSPNPNLEALIAPYGLGDGERDSILLAAHADLEGSTLVMDDHLAYLVSDRLGQRKRFLLDVVVGLVDEGTLDVGLAVTIVESIRTRYPPAFVEHTLLLLRR